MLRDMNGSWDLATTAIIRGNSTHIYLEPQFKVPPTRVSHTILQVGLKGSGLVPVAQILTQRVRVPK